MSKEQKRKDQLKHYFEIYLGIELQDSPQFLSDYLYLEFDDSHDIQRKIRIPYKNKEQMLRIDFDLLVLFCLKGIVKQLIGY